MHVCKHAGAMTTGTTEPRKLPDQRVPTANNIHLEHVSDDEVIKPIAQVQLGAA
jgi:hypothetical protein